jgi:hypothetical protein
MQKVLKVKELAKSFPLISKRIPYLLLVAMAMVWPKPPIPLSLRPATDSHLTGV